MGVLGGGGDPGPRTSGAEGPRGRPWSLGVHELHPRTGSVAPISLLVLGGAWRARAKCQSDQTLPPFWFCFWVITLSLNMSVVLSP